MAPDPNKTAPDPAAPLGACYYIENGDPKCHETTQAQCNRLGGDWYAGEACLNPVPFRKVIKPHP